MGNVIKGTRHSEERLVRAASRRTLVAAAASTYASFPGSAMAADHGVIASVMP